MTSRQAFEKLSPTIEVDVLHRVRERLEPGRASTYAMLTSGPSYTTPVDSTHPCHMWSRPGTCVRNHSTCRGVTLHDVKLMIR